MAKARKRIQGQIFQYDISTKRLNELGLAYNTVDNGYDILRIFCTGQDGISRVRRETDPVSKFAEGFKLGSLSGIKQKSSYIYAGDPPLTPEQEEEFIDELYEKLPWIKYANEKIMISGCNGITDYTEYEDNITKEIKDSINEIKKSKNTSKNNSEEIRRGKEIHKIKVFTLMAANPGITFEKLNSITPCFKSEYDNYKVIANHLSAVVMHFGLDVNTKLTKKQNEILSYIEDHENEKILPDELSRELNVSLSTVQKTIDFYNYIKETLETFKISDKEMKSIDTVDKLSKIKTYIENNPKKGSARTQKEESTPLKDVIYRIKILFEDEHQNNISRITEKSGLSYGTVKRIIECDENTAYISKGVIRKIEEVYNIDYGIKDIVTSGGYYTKMSEALSIPYDTCRKYAVQLLNDKDLWNSTKSNDNIKQSNIVVNINKRLDDFIEKREEFLAKEKELLKEEIEEEEKEEEYERE